MHTKYVLFLSALLLGGCPNGDTGDTTDTNDTDTDPQFEATVSATLPDASVEAAAVKVYDVDDNEVGTADCDGLVCTFPVSEAGDYTVKAELEGYLFVDLTAKVRNDGDETEVNWTTFEEAPRPGLWGLAPEGQYEDQDGYEYTVTTDYGDPNDYYGYDHVYLHITGMPLPNRLTDDQFEGEDELGSTVTGTVSTDLVNVTYHVAPASAPAFDRILTKVE